MTEMSLTGGTEQTSAHTPIVSLFLAFVAMVPLVGGTVVALSARRIAPAATRFSILWGGALLCFLGGVRRGLAFRQPGGTTVGEAGTMFSTFSLGAGALLSPFRVPSLLLLLAGFGVIRCADPNAARRDEAPQYFARLRPPQMMVPIVSLSVLLALELIRPSKNGQFWDVN